MRGSVADGVVAENDVISCVVVDCLILLEVVVSQWRLSVLLLICLVCYLLQGLLLGRQSSIPPVYVLSGCPYS